MGQSARPPGHRVTKKKPARTRTAKGGIIRLDRSSIEEASQDGWRGKVTSSSSSAEEHTIEEVDSSDATIAGGRKSTIAKAHNGRMGVPVGTMVWVHETQNVDSSSGEVVCYFNIPDGLTASPKNLIGSGATADTTTWDVEVDGEAVLYLPSRIYDDTATSGNWYFFRRQVTADASGMAIYVSGETRSTMPGDGYNETRHNDVQVDLIPSDGVLDFDDQQTPGTDELVVEWTLIGGQDADAGAGGNDALRTQIQGKVDTSKITAASDSGTSIFSHLCKASSATTIGETATVDSDSYAERLVNFNFEAQGAISQAVWDEAVGPGTQITRYISKDTADVSGEYEIFTGGGWRVFVDFDDATDPACLKVEATSANDFNWLSIMAIKGAVKSAPDQTIS